MTYKKYSIIALLAIASVSVPIAAEAMITTWIGADCSTQPPKWMATCDDINNINSQVVNNTSDISDINSKVNGITTYTNTAVKTLSGTVREDIIALCDSGDVVTGGGLSVVPVDRSYTLLDRNPIANLTGYSVTIQSFTSAADYTAYAICLDLTP